MKTSTGLPTALRVGKVGRKPSDDIGTTVSVRVRREHLARLDAYAASKGIARNAAIQIAIAELMERNPAN